MLFNVLSDWRNSGVAEYLTVGGGAHICTGARAAFCGGVITCATPLKQLLAVGADLFSKEGVIHVKITVQMAKGARKITTFDDRPTLWGIRTDDVACPTQQGRKPAGIVQYLVLLQVLQGLDAAEIAMDKTHVRTIPGSPEPY
ncbi:hypothetical protein F4819DRAFT_343211 [Hypoxylon fuscum]|nr:hypothetical protein F4819DRAFT_343211 [Hypoxylon fuscum]